MTILEPILYANGALRLTRHGAGKGGNVLVLEGEHTRQLDIPDQYLPTLDNFILRNVGRMTTAEMFDFVEHRLAEIASHG